MRHCKTIPKLISFSKKCNVFGKFCQNRHGKTKKNRELRVLTSGVKSDGHQKKPRELEVPGIRKDDCIFFLLSIHHFINQVPNAFQLRWWFVFDRWETQSWCLISLKNRWHLNIVPTPGPISRKLKIASAGLHSHLTVFILMHMRHIWYVIFYICT